MVTAGYSFDDSLSYISAKKILSGVLGIYPRFKTYTLLSFTSLNVHQSIPLFIVVSLASETHPCLMNTRASSAFCVRGAWNAVSTLLQDISVFVRSSQFPGPCWLWRCSGEHDRCLITWYWGNLNLYSQILGHCPQSPLG